MLKAFKLNTINMSSQIFTHQSQNNRNHQNFAKLSTNYNKKFKYNYKKSTNFLNFAKKERNNTIDLEYKHTEQSPNHKTIQQSRNMITKNPKQKIQKRRSDSSQNYMNNFIFHSNKRSKKTMSHYSQDKDQDNIHKNKTERSMYKQTVDGEANNQIPEVQNQGIKIGKHHESIQAIKKRHPSLSTNQRQFTGRTHIIDKMRSRATPKAKYTNSIIQSYKIKSIELVSPFGSRISNKKGSFVAYPYYLDLAQDQNQQNIDFADIEQIQLQKIKYDNRRTFSNNHCKQRPVTSKPAKIDDFEPKPWQSDERQGLYLKDSISYI